MIWQWFSKLGYDSNLYSIRSRSFNLTFHSKAITGTETMEIKIRDAIGTDIDNVANKLVVQNYGKEIKKAEGFKIL